MADGYDNFDRSFDYHEGGGGSFVMGLLTGTVLGAGLGMLFAPRAGSELRNRISEQASEGYRRASESAGQWAERIVLERLRTGEPGLVDARFAR